METVVAESGAPLVVLRMTLRVDDLDEFVNRYSRHIDGDRIFIFTKTPQPLGTPVRFGLYLSNGELILSGRGTVVRVQEPSANVRRPPGVELQFVPLDERSKTLVEFMQAVRSESRLPPTPGSGAGIPVMNALPAAPAGGPPPVPGASSSASGAGRPSPPSVPGALKRSESSVVSSLPAANGSAANGSAANGSAANGSAANGSAANGQGASGRTSRTGLAALLGPSRDRNAPPATPSFPSLQTTPLSEDTIAEELPSAPVASAAAVSSSPASASSPSTLAPPQSPIASTVLMPIPTEPEVVTLPPGLPAADPSLGLPANPFSEVPDDALEYFVEWSIEQSSGTTASDKAVFANVPMALPSPETDELDVPRTRPPIAWLAGTFAAGLLVAVLAQRAFIRAPSGPVDVKPNEASTAKPNEPAAAKVEASPSPPASAPESSAAPAPKTPEPSAPPTVKAPEPSAPPPVKAAERSSPATAATAATPATAATAKPAAPAAAAQPPAMKPVVKAPEPAPTPGSAPAPTPVAKAAEPKPSAPPTGAGLTIRSTPPGATVFVDGKTAGRTPLSLDASAGPHQIALRHERYATHEATVRAPGDVDVTLRRPIATLSVRSTPPGASIQLGSVPRGVTPADLKLPAYESYYVRVVFPDGRFARKQLYLKPPGDTIKATLPPKSGR